MFVRRKTKHKRWINRYLFYSIIARVKRTRKIRRFIQLTAIEYTSLSTLDDKLTVPAGVALYEKDDTDLAAAAASRINFLLISILRGTRNTIKPYVSVFMLLVKTPLSQTNLPSRITPIDDRLAFAPRASMK